MNINNFLPVFAVWKFILAKTINYMKVVLNCCQNIEDLLLKRN